MKFYPEGEKMLSKKRFIKTGEFRCPRKGEWFLSGSIAEAYLAPNDLTTEYHIVKEVKTKVVEILA